MFDVVEGKKQKAIIKVMGVGGCGGNAVDYMIEKNVMGVEFICANTDLQSLKKKPSKYYCSNWRNINSGFGRWCSTRQGKAGCIR